MIAAALAALLPAVASASPSSSSFKAYNSLDVVPLGNSAYEVIISRGEGARGVWCAAADYAVQQLGAQGRIYILEGRAPSRSAGGRQSVIFTTDEGALPVPPSRSVSLTTSQVGTGLPVNHAIQFCRGNNSEQSDRIIDRH